MKIWNSLGSTAELFRRTMDDLKFCDETSWKIITQKTQKGA